MNNKKVGDFENYLSPEYGSQDIISLLPSESTEVKEDFSMILFDPNKRKSIGLEEFVDIDDMWDDLDPGILTNKKAKTEFLKSGGRIHLHSPDNLQLSCKIGEFVEKGLSEVLFGHPFKEQIGLVEDRGKGTLWFKINDDKIIFHMPRAEKAFRKLTVKQQNLMGPLLKVSDEDKKRGIHKTEKKIKGFYRGCLSLGNEYKFDQDVIDWIQGENSEEEVTEAMAETMEQYMSKTRADYRSGIAMHKIDDKYHFEIKGQFLKELRDNTFSGLDHEDANKHIEKVLEIIDLFHVPNITQDQIMLRVFPMSLTGAASRWLRNKPAGWIKT
ncbi:hypothetical protein Tco_0967980 [Tanacetum coccineum]